MKSIFPTSTMSSFANGHSDHKPSSTTMRAAIWKGKPFHVSIDTVRKPQSLSSEDAIVRLTSSAICGSDLHIYRGILGSTNPPWTLGHEVGIVESVGEAVQNVKPGDRVIVPCTPDHGVLDIDALIAPLEVYGSGIEFGSNDGMQGTRSSVSSCSQTKTHKMQPNTSEQCRQMLLSSRSPISHPGNSITL